MNDSYNYRPKYVDIRIRKPMRVADPKPEKRVCEHPGCVREATTPAPKSRDNPKDVWWFCQEHAGLYNSNWNYFDGMTDAEFEAFQAASTHGHRDTWSFRAPPNARQRYTWQAGAAGEAYRTSRGSRRGRGGMDDAAGSGNVAAPVQEALSMLEVEQDASVAEVRRSYAELVRRFHPDANGGDRSAEGRLSAVVKAYKVLKMARRA
jgi:hypothetical protein